MITPIFALKINKNSPIRETPNNLNKSLDINEDVFCPSFCGEDIKNNFKNEMLNLDCIHCARCSKKMLSEKKYHNIHQSMTQASNGQELKKIFEDNKDYLSDSNKLILNTLDTINEKYPDANMETVLKKINEEAPLLYAKTSENNIYMLELVIEKMEMSEKDKKVYQKTVEALKFLHNNNSLKYKDFNYLMNNTLKETDFPDRKKLCDMIMKKQLNAHNYVQNISYRSLTDKTTPTALRCLCQGMFNRSRQNLVNIKKNYEDTNINKILICSECNFDTKKNSYYFRRYDDFNLLKNNFIQYLQDLNSAIKNKNLHVDDDYLKSVIKHVKYASGHQILLNSRDINFLEYRTNIKSLPFKNENGITCPKCGGIMLTHDEKVDLRVAIKQTYEIKDLVKIINDHKNCLPPLMKNLADRFIFYYKTDPHITDNTIKKYMQKDIHKVTKKLFIEFINTVDNKINDKSLYKDQKDKLQKLSKELKDYDENILYLYDSFLIKTIIDKYINIDKYDKTGLRENIQNLYNNLELLQGPIFHSKKLSEEYKSWSKLFTERLFQRAVLTKDHMVARINGGTDDIDNTIALHKECNLMKNDKPFKEWYLEDKNTEYNFLIYLDKITELSSQQKIKNCENYSSNISSKIYHLTGNSFLIEKFSTKGNP